VRGLSEVGNADLDMSNNKVSNDWKSTPIYVIKERLGRGLDLTNVKYVFLLGVPSNAASYAHLAGRTARQQGEVGTCVTVLEPRETPKLVLLAETLGFSVKCVE
jgi:superfamily II DNA/RNA helicase